MAGAWLAGVMVQSKVIVSLSGSSVLSSVTVIVTVSARPLVKVGVPVISPLASMVSPLGSPVAA